MKSTLSQFLSTIKQVQQSVSGQKFPQTPSETETLARYHLTSDLRSTELN